MTRGAVGKAPWGDPRGRGATIKPQDQRDLMAALEKFNVAADGLVSDTAPGHSPHLLARWPG